jgi:voltage-gated potassium channel
MTDKPAYIKNENENGLTGWRHNLYIVIFGHETTAGKAFDSALFIAIILSVIVVMLESVSGIRAKYHNLLYLAEWVFTILFTVEYIFRLLCVPSPGRYARSFFGIIDLLAILPTYINLFLVGTHYLMIVRVLRLLRVFRVFKLAHFLSEADVLIRALKASRVKIFVFLSSVSTLVLVIGATMYIVEGEEHGFTSIPQSVYWAIVTLTTVGYGDVTPQTVFGKFLASIVMIMGYGIIAVPTGIVSVELHQASIKRKPSVVCQACGLRNHEEGANFCRDCGAPLEAPGGGGDKPG